MSSAERVRNHRSGIVNGAERDSGTGTVGRPRGCSPQRIWLEAEAGYTGVACLPFEVKKDENASGFGYVVAPMGSGSSIDRPTEGSISLTFEAGGPIRVWARVKPVIGRQNALFVKLDEDDAFLWTISSEGQTAQANPEPAGENTPQLTAADPDWEWQRVGDFTVEEGEHVLMFLHGTEGTRLDRILVSEDLDYVPSGRGEHSESNEIFQFATFTPDYHAFMWLPPQAPYIRGLVVVHYNLCEPALVQSPSFRKVCTEEKIGIVYSMGYGESRKIQATFDYENGAGRLLTEMLNRLAEESGYPEVAHAPLMTVGHSFASGMGWIPSSWNKSRIFAQVALKSGMGTGPIKPTEEGLDGTPTYLYCSQWTEHVKYDDRERGIRDQQWVVDNWRKNPNNLVTATIEWGAGHYEFSEEACALMALYLKKVARARIPDEPALHGPVELRDIRGTGVLLPVYDKAHPEYSVPVPEATYTGDKTKMLWFIDEEFALAALHFSDKKMRGDKRIQVVGLVTERGGAPREFSFAGGPPSMYQNVQVNRTEPDPETGELRFELEGGFFPRLPLAYDPATPEIGHSNSDRIHMSKILGPIEIVSEGKTAATFVWKNNFINYNKQQMAYVGMWHPGDEEYCYAIVPVGISLPNNTEGEEQTIDFAEIPDITVETQLDAQCGTQKVQLSATSSSGLPVDLFVHYGPAMVVGNELIITDIPAKAKYPVKVVVVATQWGRGGERPIKAATPVERTFYITRGL